MRLLVIEDNVRLASLIARHLHEAGLTVDSVASMAEAEAALAVASFDVVLLDLSLPDGDGQTLLARMRARGANVPVLVITARGAVDARVRALDAGADDYLVKPFSVEELLARIRAVRRRAPTLAPKRLVAGRASLDPEAGEFEVGSEKVELPRRELAVLAALLARKGHVLRREALEQAVYSFDDAVTPNAVEAVVSRLRRRLATTDAGIEITALRGIGYILTETT